MRTESILNRSGPETTIEHVLRTLAARPVSQWPLASVYLNLRAASGDTGFRAVLKKRGHEALAALPARSPEHESLRVDLDRVQNYVDYDLAESTRALAIYACFGESDLFEAVQLPVPLGEQAVHVGPLPVLWPLLQVADHSQRAAVLLSDTHAARLFVISLGRVEVRREVRSPMLQRIKGAGEGDALHAQRHVDEARKKHARLAIATLEELAHEAGAAWLLVAGEVEILPDMAAALSREGGERLLAPPATWDTHLAEDQLVARVQEQIDAREAELRRALAERVAEAGPGLHAGRAACGLSPTIEALREARVAELVLSSAFPADLAGWSCHACGTFGEGPPAAACPACGRATLDPVTLREELCRKALVQGARVRFVEPLAVAAFEACGGVGAALRYP